MAGRGPFMPAPPSTFRFRKGKALTDGDLLIAWKGISTDAIRELEPETAEKPYVVNAARARVLALREKRERGDV